MKNLLTASAMVLGLTVAVTSPAFAFGPLGGMIQNMVTEQVKSAVTSATGAAVNATVAAVTSGTALEGNALVGAAANAAAGAATGQGTGAIGAGASQAGALSDAMSNPHISGGGKAFLLGNVAAGALGKGIQGAASKKAAGGEGGISYTLGSDTAANVHAMASAYQQAVAACSNEQGCQQCVMADFQAQSSSSVGKTGTYTMGGGCFGTTTAGKEDVAPAAGNDSVKWD